MKFSRIMSLVSLVSFSGIAAQVYGQEKREEKQPEKQQAQPKQQAKPQAQRAQQPKQQAQPQERQKPEATRPATAAKPQQRQQQQARPATAAKPQKQQARPATAAKPQEREKARPATAAKPRTEQHQPVQRAQQQQPTRAANAGRQQSYSPPERSNQQAKTWQQQASWHPQGSWQEHSSWQQDRSSNWQSDHRTWAQRGGYGGYYIPEANFSLHFGAEHWFRIQSQPSIVDGYPRFQYGGYSFMIVDPWPAAWAENWYAADDVYVGYDNGYYLYNRAYPGEAIAITVVL